MKFGSIINELWTIGPLEKVQSHDAALLRSVRRKTPEMTLVAIFWDCKVFVRNYYVDIEL
jgi:hypothetical protein